MGCWGGERVPLASKENHTKGGMKKLLLCTNSYASSVPTFKKMPKIAKFGRIEGFFGENQPINPSVREKYGPRWCEKFLHPEQLAHSLHN